MSNSSVNGINNNSIYKMDRIRLESIERRRQKCSDTIKQRKRKLAELYYVSKSPLIPVSAQEILKSEDRLLAFLEKNDLENGHGFQASKLPSSSGSNNIASLQQQQQLGSRSRSQSQSPVLKNTIINNNNNRQGVSSSASSQSKSSSKKSTPSATPTAMGTPTHARISATQTPPALLKNNDQLAISQQHQLTMSAPPAMQNKQTQKPVNTIINTPIVSDIAASSPITVPAKRSANTITSDEVISPSKFLKVDNSEGSPSRIVVPSVTPVLAEQQLQHQQQAQTQQLQQLQKESGRADLIQSTPLPTIASEISNSNNSGERLQEQNTAAISAVKEAANNISHNQNINNNTNINNNDGDSKVTVAVNGSQSMTASDEQEREKLDEELKAQQEQKLREKELYAVSPIPHDYVETPTLSSLILAFSQSKQIDDLGNDVIQKSRELNLFDNIDISKLSVLLMPENYPSKIAESSPLAELYYLTQTCPLSKLLPGTNKTLTTDTYESALLEGKVAVVYSRIEELKRQKKWSLRQPGRFVDPFTAENGPSSSHWNSLLTEMKWMSVDFAEARKFKLVQCFYIAQSVMDYWNYGKIVCAHGKPVEYYLRTTRESSGGKVRQQSTDGNPASKFGEKITTTDSINEEESNERDVHMEDSIESTDNKDVTKEEQDEESASENPVDSVSQAEEESEDHHTQSFPKEDSEDWNIDVSLLLERPNPADEIVPPKLPEISEQDFAKLEDKSFQPFKIYVDSEDLTNTDAAIIENLPTYIAFDDFKEEKAIDPYLKNPITAVSRLLTPIDEDDEEWYKVVMRNDDSVTSPLASTYQKGFFGLNGQKRLNFIKPPLPPSLKYLDLRTPTIWLPEDDRYLIHYIAEYQFNWNIVSAHLSAHPTRGYSSNIERRTPWQCFERYIQLNDKFQFSDMRGGYSSLAQQWLEAAHKAQATTKRRISPLGVGSDSIQRGHKRLRWASMFDAIRKCMRKRENAPKPSNSPHKKFNDEKKGNVPTPAELSKLKFDRDKAIQEAYMHQSNANGNFAMRAKNAAAAVLAQQAAQQKLVGNNSTSNTSSSGSSNSVVGNPANQQLQGTNVLKPQNQQRIQNAQRIVTNGNPRQNVMNGGAQQPQGMISNTNAPGIRNGNVITKPTTPNGTPYTNEQIQHLLQLQRQRKLMQQNSASASPAGSNGNNSNSSTPLLSLANLNAAASGGKASVSVAGSPNQTSMVPNSSNQVTMGGNNNAYTNNNNNNNINSNGRSPSIQNSPVVTNTAAPLRKLNLSNFSNAHVSAIINQIQLQNPKMSKADVTKLAANYLHNLTQQQQAAQNRTSHAMGVNQRPNNGNNGNNGSNVNNGNNNGNRQGNVSGSPQMNPSNSTNQVRRQATNLSMLTPEQLTTLANNPNLTEVQRKQILMLKNIQQQKAAAAQQQQQLRNASNQATRAMLMPQQQQQQQQQAQLLARQLQNGPSTTAPTPQQLAAQRASIQQQQQHQHQQHQRQQQQNLVDGTTGGLINGVNGGVSSSMSTPTNSTVGLHQQVPEGSSPVSLRFVAPEINVNNNNLSAMSSPLVQHQQLSNNSNGSTRTNSPVSGRVLGGVALNQQGNNNASE